MTFIELNTYRKTVGTEIIKFLVKTDYRVKNGLLRLLQNLLFHNKSFEGAGKILVFRNGSIGDSICAMPSIYSIKKNFPKAEIDVLTNAGGEGSVSLGNLIDKSLLHEIINYSSGGSKSLFGYLKKKRYELVIELPQYDVSFFRELRNMIILKMSGAKAAFGFEVGSTRLFPRYQQRLFHFVNERERLLRIIGKYGISDFGLHYPLAITEGTKAKVESLADEKAPRVGGLREKGKNIAMVPGAKRRQNRWPIENFKRTAAALAERGYNIILLGGNDDVEAADQIEGDCVFNFCGRLKPLETAEMLKYCELTITNDTGPMHLSYAVGTPVIAIFSGRDYSGKWYPPEDGKNVVFRDYSADCEKCFEKYCDNSCLRQIKSDQILRSVEEKVNIVYA